MKALDTGLHYPIDLAVLPETWTAQYVGVFCDVVQSGFACGNHNDSDIGIGHLRPMNVSRAGRLDFDTVKSVPSTYDDRRLVLDDVLFNNTNSPELIGKTAYVSQQGAGLAFSNHMTRLRFNGAVEPRFGAYQLHYLWMGKYFLHACVKHVNQASISTRDLSTSVPFVAPPLNEQRRIVAKIEELFSELDAGVESLKTAREQLKVYRQALLKHAFEGKLTAAWRAENADKLESAEELLARILRERRERWEADQLAKYQAAGKKLPKGWRDRYVEPVAPDTVDLPELPCGWVWTSVDAVGDVLLGRQRAPQFLTGRYFRPYLRVANISDDRIDFSDLKEMDFDSDHYEK